MPTVPFFQVLWSTRGKHWGFRFLSYPSCINDPNFWLRIHDRIFTISADVPFNSQGMVAMPDGSSVPYVAARFYDEKYDWRDDSGGLGRKISHEIMLLIPENNEIALLDSNWPQAIMNVLRPIYSDLYPIPRKEIMHYAKTNYLETKKLVVHRIPEVGQIFELLEVMGLIASNPEKSSGSAIGFNSNAYLLRLLIAFTGLSIIAIFSYIIIYYSHIH